MEASSGDGGQPVMVVEDGEGGQAAMAVMQEADAKVAAETVQLFVPQEDEEPEDEGPVATGPVRLEGTAAEERPVGPSASEAPVLAAVQRSFRLRNALYPRVYMLKHLLFELKN